MVHIIVLIIGVGILGLNIIFGVKDYRKAKSFEKKRDFKSACYYYAISILKGGKAGIMTKRCRERIKYLWKQYGPFDYKDVLDNILKEGDTPERCCEIEHAVTVDTINKIVSDK